MAPQTIGEQARRVFEKQLAEHYQGWNVSIGKGLYRPGVGLQFENITLTSNSATGSESGGASGRVSITDAILSRWSAKPDVVIDRLTVLADIDARKLLDQKNPMMTRRVVIEGVTADMRWRSDGSLSLAGLWPPPQLGPICPRIDLRRVTLNLFVDAKSIADATRSGPNSSRVTAAKPVADEQRPIQFRWSQILLGNTSEIAEIRDGGRRFTLRGESDFFNTCSVEVDQTLRQGEVVQTTIKSKVSGLRVNDSVVEQLATWLPQSVPQGASFDLLGDLNVRIQKGRLERDPGAKHANNSDTLDYQFDYVLRDGRYADVRLPNPIENLHGHLRITPQRIALYPTTAQLGAATCRIEGSAAIEMSVLAAEKIVAPGKARSLFALDAFPADTVPDDTFSFMLGQSRWVARLGDCRLQVSATDLMIDDSFRRLLPARPAVLFDRFEPSGQIDFVAQLSNPSPLHRRPWTVDAEVSCEGVGIQFEKFPYPVRSLRGLIQIAGGRVDTRLLTGTAGGRPIHCEFNVPLKFDPNLPVSPEKTIIIRSDGAIPIDNALVSALTPRSSGENQNDEPEPSLSKVESFIRSLHPRGSIELARASVQTDAQGKTSRQFDLRVIGGTLRYDAFAYPLYNVTGRVQVKDDLVRIIGFNANNAGAAKIGCDGIYQMPNSASGSELNLRFRVDDIAMDHSLRVSIPESSRTIWEELSPAGTLDELDVQIKKLGTEPIELTLTASHQSESRVAPNNLSIRPKAIPYRIDIAGGNVDYRNGVVTIKDLRGRHDASRLIADGVCRPDASGRWLLTLDLHSGCRLVPDDELLAALPDQMSGAMRGLDLRGPLGMRGVTNILLPENANDSPAMNWDLILQLEGNRIADVGPIHSLRGEIMVRGVKSGDLLRAGGKLAIDSLHAYGLQVTSLRGPFSILGDEMRLGTLAAAIDPITGKPSNTTPNNGAPMDTANPPRQPPIVGRIFDGRLDVSGIVALSSGDFDVGVAIANGQLATLLAEMGQTRSGITGRVDMNSRLDGRLGDADLLKGFGTARVSGANMYELPFLVQVLNLLRITPTEDVAFTDGETEFSIFGEDINFNRLSMWGDLVALDGKGTLSRLEHLDLSFNTKVSPQNMFSKVISPLRDNAYTFWTIEIDGPLSAPTIQRHALGGVAQTLESWFPGMVRSTTANTSVISR